MTTNTPQELGRTDDVHDHDSKLFCIQCIEADAQRNDPLGDLATLATIELKQLAQLRIEQQWLSCAQAWQSILDAQALETDLRCKDLERREVAMRVRETLDDYLNLRVLMRYAAPKPLILAHAERSIQKRVRAKLDEIERKATDVDTIVPAH